MGLRFASLLKLSGDRGRPLWRSNAHGGTGSLLWAPDEGLPIVAARRPGAPCEV